MKRIGWGWFLVGALLMLPFSAWGQTLDEGGGTNLGTWITLGLAVLGAVIGVLREIAPKTPTDFDDKALAVLSKIAPTLERIADPTDPMQAPTPDNPSGRS